MRCIRVTGLVSWLVMGLLIVLLGQATVSAQSVSFSAEVGDTGFILEGSTFPNAIVSFEELGGVIGTTVADSFGVFSKEFTSQTYGPHQITITSADGSESTRPVTVDFVAIRFSSVTISNLNLPPLTSLNGSTFTPGNLLILSGKAQPNTAVEVLISGPTNITFSTTTDSSGNYSVSVAATSLLEGSYTISATVQLSSNLSSTTSSSIAFTIDYPNPTATPSVTPTPTSNTIPNGPSATTQPGGGETNNPTSATTATPVDRISPTQESECVYKYERLCFFDKEQIGVLNFEEEFMNFLTGFTRLLLRSFGKNGQLLPLEEDSVFDVNKDNKIDVVDFSIALYHASRPTSGILGIVTSQTGDIPAEFTMPQQGAFFVQPLFLVLGLGLLLVLFSALVARIVHRYFLQKQPSPLKLKVVWGVAIIVVIATSIVLSQQGMVIQYLQGSISTMALAPTRIYRQEQQFELPILISTNKTATNAIQADLRFDPQRVKVKRIDTNKSFATIFVTKDFSNKEGWIRIIGGIPHPGFSGKNGLYATVIFETLDASGKSTIQFIPTSRILADDGNGTDLLYSFDSAQIVVKD